MQSQSIRSWVVSWVETRTQNLPLPLPTDPCNGPRDQHVDRTIPVNSCSSLTFYWYPRKISDPPLCPRPRTLRGSRRGGRPSVQCDLSTDYHRQYRKIENPRGRYTSDLDLQIPKSADYNKFIKGRDSFQGHDSLGKSLQYVCVSERGYYA